MLPCVLRNNAVGVSDSEGSLDTENEFAMTANHAGRSFAVRTGFEAVILSTRSLSRALDLGYETRAWIRWMAVELAVAVFVDHSDGLFEGGFADACISELGFEALLEGIRPLSFEVEHDWELV